MCARRWIILGLIVSLTLTSGCFRRHRALRGGCCDIPMPVACDSCCSTCHSSPAVIHSPAIVPSAPTPPSIQEVPGTPSAVAPAGSAMPTLRPTPVVSVPR